MSKITLKYSGKDYVLEYSRQSVRMIESQGFVAEQLSAKPMTMIPILFQGAFIKNHKGMKRNLIDEIYEGIADKSALIVALVDMYTETVSTLLEDKEDEGNVKLGGDQVTGAATPSYTDIFEQSFPYYLVMGMSYEQFWEGDLL